MLVNLSNIHMKKAVSVSLLAKVNYSFYGRLETILHVNYETDKLNLRQPSPTTPARFSIPPDTWNPSLPGRTENPVGF